MVSNVAQETVDLRPPSRPSTKTWAGFGGHVAREHDYTQRPPVASSGKVSRLWSTNKHPPEILDWNGICVYTKTIGVGFGSVLMSIHTTLLKNRWVRCQALTKLLSFLYSRDITVQIMKLFRSKIWGFPKLVGGLVAIFYFPIYWE